MALPKANRLRRSQEFSAVYQRGSRCKSTHLTLRALRQRPLTPPPQKRSPSSASGGLTKAAAPFHPSKVISPARSTRIGVCVSTKVSKRAVVRNRIKRHIQAILYQFLSKFPTGWDLVVVIHPSATGCDYAGFLQELEQLLMNAEVFNGH